jgi:hypothetical protein
MLNSHNMEYNTLFKNNKSLRGLNLKANYTYRATATFSAKLVPTFAEEGVSRGQRGGSPTALFSVF